MKKYVILKPGREKSPKNFHHWIFSGAVASSSDFEDGEILPVVSSQGELLGHAYFNRASGICGRFVSFGKSDPLETIQNHLEKAFALRKKIFENEDTTAYRLVNSEGDFLPGLIVDVYGDIAVLQITTLGMEKLKPMIVEFLKNIPGITAIYEKSDSSARREEEMLPFVSWLYGKEREEVIVKERGISFSIHFPTAQKTGLFLDQREMRTLVQKYAKGRTVLNCFSYTGGFNLFALQGGAKKADAVEIVGAHRQSFEKNIEINGYKKTQATFFEEDVFEFLRSEKVHGYDFIILDPPAFAKKRDDTTRACRGYKDMNRLAMKNLPENGFLLTSSCSHFVDRKLFQQVVFEAAVEANREVQIFSEHILAPDHPLNVYHPEGEYLKSFLLHVRDS